MVYHQAAIGQILTRDQVQMMFQIVLPAYSISIHSPFHKVPEEQSACGTYSDSDRWFRTDCRVRRQLLSIICKAQIVVNVHPFIASKTQCFTVVVCNSLSVIIDKHVVADVHFYLNKIESNRRYTPFLQEGNQFIRYAL